MNGGRILNSLIFALLALGIIFCPSYAFGSGPVVILLSDEEKAYTMPVATFKGEVDSPVEIVNLRGDIKKAPAIMEQIFSRKPCLIFALGAKASYIARVWTVDRPEIPVIFAMVLNWERYGLMDGHDHIAGIASDVDPGAQFANMTMISPRVRRIGVLYSREHSSQIVAKAKEAAGKLGLELVAQQIDHSEDFQRSYKKIAGHIDGFWILTDPVVYTLENMAWLEKRCIEDRMVCLGQSRNIAKLGVLLAVDADIPNIGFQAASMAKNILLRNQSPKKLGVMPPLGTRIYLNAKTAKEIGLVLNPSALDMASEIIDR